jgi:hypothetical protein
VAAVVAATLVAVGVATTLVVAGTAAAAAAAGTEVALHRFALFSAFFCLHLLDFSAAIFLFL